MTPHRRKAIARRKQRQRIGRHVVDWFVMTTAKAVASSDELAMELSRTVKSPEEIFERITKKVSHLPYRYKKLLWEAIKSLREYGHEDPQG